MIRVVLPRRRALAALGGALATPMIASGLARAQNDWPNKSVRYINLFPAGGATDVLSRIVCQELSELTGQQFIVENKGGSGTSPHLCGEMLKQRAGINMFHVPYRGGAPALQDMLAGQVDTMFDNIPGPLAQVKAGKLRPLAVTSLERSPVAPEVPPISDYYPGFQITSWGGLCGPAGLSPAMVEKAAALTMKAVQSKAVKSAFLA
jgi:tripartite-type tricarboxylate transporter receptor subunit TctC